MPQPGKQWYHIVLNTRGTWLHGDPRGFRARNARIRSTGDYKTPPPAGEHASLHRWHQHRSGPPVRLAPHLLPIIRDHIVAKLRAQNHRLLVLSVDPVHVHVLVELPNDRKLIRRIVGTWKQAASHAVRREMPGKLWAEDCNPELIREEQHQRNTFHYILRHGGRGALIWRFDEDDSSD